MSPEYSFSDEEHRFFRANYALEEDGKILISVQRTYYSEDREMVIVPESGRIRRYDELEQASGPVFTLGRDEACVVVASRGEHAHIFELAHLVLDKGLPSIEAAGCVITNTLGSSPRITRAEEIVTGEGMLVMPLHHARWVKIIVAGEVPVRREIPPLEMYTPEQLHELTQPARWMRLVKEFRTRGE